jgi:hypothetical protein
MGWRRTLPHGGAHRVALVPAPNDGSIVVDVRSWAEGRLEAGPRPRILVPTARQRAEVAPAPAEPAPER